MVSPLFFQASSSNLIIGGNVGIGTTVPTTKLHVVGDINVSDSINVSGSNTGSFKPMGSVNLSGTSVNYIGIPQWAKRITVVFNDVTTSAVSDYLVQIGSGSIKTTGYISMGAYENSSGSGFVFGNSTAGFIAFHPGNTAAITYAIMTIIQVTDMTWVASVTGVSNISTSSYYAFDGGGTVTLAGVLDRVRFTTVNGTYTFSSGTINVYYEG